MTFDIKLLPDYDKWHENSPNDPEIMLVYNTRIISFAATLDIIRPEIVARRGLYLRVPLMSNLDDYPYDEFLSSGLSYSEIESRLNRLRVKDLFQHDPDTDKVDSRLLAAFAREIQRYWQFNLSWKYPDEKFIVLIVDPEVDPEVTLFSQR